MSDMLLVQPPVSTKQEVIDRYLKQGYHVVVDPDWSQLPFDLHGYRPDIIATRPGSEGLMISVRTQTGAISIEELTEAARVIRDHGGWRLILMTGEDVTELHTDDLLTPEEIATRLGVMEPLIAEGQGETALLLAWSLLEAALRTIAVRSEVPVEKMRVDAMADYLYSLGELSLEQYEALIPLRKVRNQVAHGLRATGALESARQLREIVSHLLEYIDGFPDNDWIQST